MLIIVEEYVASLAFDLIAILILFGMCMVPKKKGEKENTGTLIFVGMGICIIVGSLFDLFCCMLVNTSYRWGVAAVYASRTISEFAILLFLFCLLLYTDYKLFGSKDHLKRHFGVFLIPPGLIIILYIINFFTGILFGVDAEMRWEPTKFYYIVTFVKYVYLVIPPIHYMRSFLKSEKKRFLHPLSIYVPILAGTIISLLTPFSTIYLGCAVGLVLMIFSGIDSWRYADIKTSFFNKVYIEHILNMIRDKKESRKSMIIFEAKGDQAAFAGLLMEELPADNEKVALGNGKVAFISDTGSMEQLKSLAEFVKDGAEEYDSTHSDKILLSQSICRIFKDDEDALAAIKGLKEN